jgi:hypothetical protein
MALQPRRAAYLGRPAARLSGLLDQLPSSHIILADAKALVDELS